MIRKRRIFTTAAVGLMLLALQPSPALSQVFQDDFSDPAMAGWERICGPNGDCYVENQELHMTSGNQETAIAAIRDLRPDSYRFEFDYKQVTWAGYIYVRVNKASPGRIVFDQYQLEQEGIGHIYFSKKLTLPEPVVINGVEYDRLHCYRGERDYHSSVHSQVSATFPESCWYEPLSNYRNGIIGHGADNRWHHQIITKRGPEVTWEIPDIAFKSVYYDCQPVLPGYQALEVWNDATHKHAHFDNVRLEVLEGPARESWDSDLNGIADVCQDDDGDGVQNGTDNCPTVANPGQEDRDSDSLGDVCDPYPDNPSDDVDGDGRPNAADNCPDVANPDQRDADADGLGDACDSCHDLDGDGFFYEEGCGTEPDCNDSDASIHPSSIEACDGIDNDCDQFVDESGCLLECSSPGVVGQYSQVSDTGDEARSQALAWTGSYYGVAWSDDAHTLDTEIYFALLDANGESLTPSMRVTDAVGESRDPSVVWTGSEFGLVWSDSRDGNGELYFTRISATGALLMSPTRLTNAPAFSGFAKLVWNGQEYGVAWHDLRASQWADVYFMRIDRFGNKIGIDRRITTTPGDSLQPTITWNGEKYGLAWSDTRDQDFEIYFVILSTFGDALSPEIRITDALGQARVPKVHWNGQRFDIFWNDDRTGAPHLFHEAVETSGEPLGIQSLIQAVDLDDFLDPVAIDWNGERYGLAWVGGHDLKFLAVMIDNPALGSPTTLESSAPAAGHPDIAWNGAEFAVTWVDPLLASPAAVLFTRVGCECVDLVS